MRAATGAHLCISSLLLLAQGNVARTWLGTAQPAAILFIADAEREQLSRKGELRERFALTRAEVDFAMEIIKGDGRQAAAARLGISLATARTHLEHIFEKTGARRQAELVQLLQSSDNGPTDRTGAADEL